MNEIKVTHVKKNFKGIEIITDANAVFIGGKIYGIIGPNGSGKSVLLQLICGLMKANEGSVSYNGIMLDHQHPVLPSCGIIINKPGFFMDMSGFQNLKLFARLKNKITDKDIENVLGRVKLKNDNKPVKQYSLGMQQRLGFAQAIMEKPEVLILDEFTNALDEDGVSLVYEILREERKKGTIIIVTSHISDDIETLCDETFRLKEGILVYETSI